MDMDFKDIELLVEYRELKPETDSYEEEVELPLL